MLKTFDNRPEAKTGKKNRKEWREGSFSNGPSPTLGLAPCCAGSGDSGRCKANRDSQRPVCQVALLTVGSLVLPGEQVQTRLLLIPDIWPLPQLTSVRPL